MVWSFREHAPWAVGPGYESREQMESKDRPNSEEPRAVGPMPNIAGICWMPIRQGEDNMASQRADSNSASESVDGAIPHRRANDTKARDALCSFINLPGWNSEARDEVCPVIQTSTIFPFAEQ